MPSGPVQQSTPGGQVGQGQQSPRQTGDAPRGASASGPPVAQQGAPAILRDYRGVTEEQLRKPADGDWPMYRRTYDGQGYSPLSRINTDNVRRLAPVWSFATGMVEGHQAPPIVVNGVMFVATPQNQVLALDARTGDLLWRFKRPVPEDMMQLHPTSRGVAVLGDKVYFASADAFIVAIDARSGQEVWATKVEDYNKGYYMTLAPLLANGRVMVGVSGGELGVRGFIAGFDVATGERTWTAHVIPAPGEPGSETWPQGDQWKTGGGSVWITGIYDPTTNLSYWGTGNGGPWLGDQRPGDNLYTSSVLAIDVTSGAIKGHFQYHPNDSWDWDEVASPVIIDFERNGRSVKGLVHAARNGYLWTLERTADAIKFIDAKPFVKQDVFRGVDPKTGRVDVNEERKPRTGRTTHFCPSLWGGKDWPPMAYSPQTRLLYIPANENLCGSITGEPVRYSPGQRFTGATSTLYAAPGAEYIGELQAWDIVKGEKVWSYRFPKSQNWGPVLATGGDLVFMGGTNDRYFRAFHAKTGNLLWEQRLNSGVTGVPVSFEIGGKQYIAVQSGWGVDAQRMQIRLGQALGWNPDVPQGGTVWVFAVSD